MNWLWTLFLLGGSAYSAYRLITGVIDGRIAAGFAVIVDRREDALAFWTVAVIRFLLAIGLLLLAVIVTL